MRPSIVEALPAPSTIVVLSFSTTTFLALPSASSVLRSAWRAVLVTADTGPHEERQVVDVGAAVAPAVALVALAAPVPVQLPGRPLLLIVAAVPALCSGLLRHGTHSCGRPVVAPSD